MNILALGAPSSLGCMEIVPKSVLEAELINNLSDPVRIASVRDRLSKPLSNAKPTIGLGEQHHPAIGTDPPAVKGGRDLLAADGWKAERQKLIVGHGGRGARDPGKGLALATESNPTLDQELTPL